MPAEYGRMTGGVVNVVTKSGSNLFKGSLFANGEGGLLQSDDNTRDKRPAWTTTVTDVSRPKDFGGELGGPIARDRLWFFGAYNRTNEDRNTTVIRALASPGSPGINTEIPTSIDRDLFAAKVTFKLSPGQTLNGTIMGDPSTRDGAVFTIAGPESTWKGVRDIGGTDYVAQVRGRVRQPVPLERHVRATQRERHVQRGRTRHRPAHRSDRHADRNLRWIRFLPGSEIPSRRVEGRRLQLSGRA